MFRHPTPQGYHDIHLTAPTEITALPLPSGPITLCPQVNAGIRHPSPNALPSQLEIIEILGMASPLRFHVHHRWITFQDWTIPTPTSSPITFLRTEVQGASSGYIIHSDEFTGPNAHRVIMSSDGRHPTFGILRNILSISFEGFGPAHTSPGGSTTPYRVGPISFYC
jgi:hypothetical protein